MMRMVSARDGRGWGRAIPKHAAAYNHDMEKKKIKKKWKKKEGCLWKN